MTEPLDFGFDTYLGQVPETLRDQVKPVFENYSKALQEQVNGQMQTYEPYKPIVEQGWEPEALVTGLNLLQMVNENPQRVYEALLQEYPQLAQQQTPPTPPTPPAPTPSDSGEFNLPPEYTQKMEQMEQMMQLLFQGFQQQQEQSTQFTQQQQEQLEMQEFSQYLDQVAPEDKYHRPFILSYIAQGQTPEQAIKSYTDWQNSQVQGNNRMSAPLVAPANGGTPSAPIDTSKLSDQDRKALMVQYLMQANQQNQ